MNNSLYKYVISVKWGGYRGVPAIRLRLLRLVEIATDMEVLDNMDTEQLRGYSRYTLVSSSTFVVIVSI